MQDLQTTKIIRTGTSLCVVIPKSILKAVGLDRGDQVVFGIAGPGTIAIHKLTQQEIINVFNASAGATAINK